jgi:hypothetical protein
MMHPSDDLPLDPSPDEGIPDFLRRKEEVKPEVPVTPSKKVEVTPMRTDDEAADATETEAPAKPAKAPKASKPRKPAAKAAGKGNGKAPVKAKGKALAKAAAPAKPAKAKAKTAKAERVRDPAKLDAFGFRKESIKSKAAAMYAKGKGATLAEVKEELGSVQFNLLTELQGKGHKVDKSEVKSASGRMITRYKLHGKD